jgi:hypothetical protein
MGEFEVTQRTSDGMFNATSLLKQWNDKNDSGKKLDHYFDNKSTIEFINTIISRENSNTRNSVYLKNRGIFGGTWMTPILFIDFAMWINPSFKYDVLKFVYDELIKYRNEAGDAYREMCSAVAKIVDKKNNTSIAITKVAKALNYIVYNAHESEIRNKQAEENKVKELAELEKDVTKLINQGFILTFDQLIKYLRQLWSDKYLPKELIA